MEADGRGIFARRFEVLRKFVAFSFGSGNYFSSSIRREKWKCSYITFQINYLPKKIHLGQKSDGYFSRPNNTFGTFFSFSLSCHLLRSTAVFSHSRKFLVCKSLVTLSFNHCFGQTEGFLLRISRCTAYTRSLCDSVFIISPD